MTIFYSSKQTRTAVWWIFFDGPGKWQVPVNKGGKCRSGAKGTVDLSQKVTKSAFFGTWEAEANEVGWLGLRSLPPCLLPLLSLYINRKAKSLHLHVILPTPLCDFLGFPLFLLLLLFLPLTCLFLFLQLLGTQTNIVSIFQHLLTNRNGKECRNSRYWHLLPSHLCSAGNDLLPFTFILLWWLYITRNAEHKFVFFIFVSYTRTTIWKFVFVTLKSFFFFSSFCYI